MKPNKTFNEQERDDYNTLMKKLSEQELTDLDEARRLRNYLERVKKDAQTQNDNDVLFAVIILLGIMALTIGLLSSKERSETPQISEHVSA